MPTIEVAVPFRDNWYFDAVDRGIAERAERAGATTRVLAALPGAAGRERVAAHLEAALAEEGCIGAVAVGYEFRAPQVERLLAGGKPVVVVGGVVPGLPGITLDDAAVARAATEQLLALGHTAVTHLAGYAISADDFSMRSDRVRGYSEAMRAAGLEAQSHVVPCEFTHDAAYRAAARILAAGDRPTAVFAVADELALAVLDAAADLGLAVPGDLSVIGVDDHPRAAARGLTTWRQDPEAIGAAAAERVLGLADFDVHEVGLTAVARSSTAPPAGRTGGRRSRRLLPRLLARR